MDLRTARMMTLVLAALCGLLLLSALIQFAGYGRGYGWLPPDLESDPVASAEIDQTPITIPPMSRFAEVDNRPLFNDDRKPTPHDDGEEEADAPPPVPLNVTLTGVIIVRKTESTSELRVAMLRDNLRNESLALKVGMPLSGDQAGWTLVSVEPRMATFSNSADEKAEIELNTSATPARAPIRPVAQPAPPSRQPESLEKRDNSAESDLAKRIEERRRQMREEAERLRSQRGNSPTGQKN